MKKQQQLGMNPSTASNRLVKDILFQFISEAEIVCFQCGMALSRKNFSIEHKEPWLDSENPKEKFFDLTNISFRHLKCNVEERRTTVVAKCGTNSKYTTGCRCDACKRAHADYAKSRYASAKRSAKYLRTGT